MSFALGTSFAEVVSPLEAKIPCEVERFLATACFRFLGNRSETKETKGLRGMAVLIGKMLGGTCSLTSHPSI